MTEDHAAGLKAMLKRISAEEAISPDQEFTARFIADKNVTLHITTGQSASKGSAFWRRIAPVEEKMTVNENEIRSLVYGTPRNGMSNGMTPDQMLTEIFLKDKNLLEEPDGEEE